MTESLQMALTLLAVGMTTVFVVLLGVIGSGRLVIQTVNRFSKDVPLPTSPVSHDDSVDPKQIAIIAAAVSQATKGRGRVEKIEKL